MDFLTDWLTNWLKGLLIEGIMGNLEGLFDTVNTRVGEICRTGGDYPGGMERRGVLPDTAAFRNGDIADCRIDPDLCCHL